MLVVQVAVAWKKNRIGMESKVHVISLAIKISFVLKKGLNSEHEKAQEGSHFEKGPT